MPKVEHPAASLIRIGIGVAIGTSLLWAVSPALSGCLKSADRTATVNNLKIIGLALQSFDAEYGEFPNAATAPQVKTATRTPLTLGAATSNQLFRQLLVTNLIKEDRFHSGSFSGDEVDGDFSDDAHALAPGECSFAYVTGLNIGCPPDTPVVFWPLIPGTLKFDARLAKGSAFMLTLDNQVKGVSLDSAGQGRINGMDLFDPRQPFWHGRTPDLRWPE